MASRSSAPANTKRVARVRDGDKLPAIGDLPDHPHIDQRIQRPRPLVSDYIPRLQPVIVTGLGRSGTTWLVRLLMQDERIVLHRGEEHELEGARHWMNVLLAYFEGQWWDGQHPFETNVRDEVKEWIRADYPRTLAAFCQKSIDEFYLLLARSQGQSNPLFFAEKSPANESAALVSELYPAGKEIFLVRDFRDVHCSIVAFSRKTGRRAFRWQAGWSEESYLRERGKHVEEVRAAWLARRDRSLLIRYEDLIREPIRTLEKLFGYLHLSHPAGGIERMLAAARTIDYESHRTSSSDEESIGRWRRELSPPHRSLANELFAKALVEFGYEET